MPTQLPSLRRSGRNAGKKIATPKYQHDLFQDPPKGGTNRKAGNNKRKQQAITKEIAPKKTSNNNDEEAYVPLELDDSSDEEEQVVNPKTHASKNYKKLNSTKNGRSQLKKQRNRRVFAQPFKKI